MSNKKQSQPLKKKLIFTMFIVVTILCVLEIGLRVGGYIVLKLNPPLITTSNIKDKDEFIILCLGDSYTFGLGTDYQHSYPRQLERLLSEKYNQVRFKVYNLGIPGSNSSQLVNNLLQNINKYNPDLLIIMSGRNDTWNFTDTDNPSLLDQIRVYKLAKIIRANLSSFIEKHTAGAAIASVKVKDSKKQDDINIGKREILSPESHKQVKAGYSFMKQGRYDLAEKCFLRATQIGPDNVNAYRGLGRIYREMGKYQLSEKYLQKALSRQKGRTDFVLYLELGMVHIGLNKYHLAREELRKVLAGSVDNHNNQLAFNELYRSYKDEREFYKNIEQFKKNIKDRAIVARIDRLVELKSDKENIYRILRRNMLKIYEMATENNVKIIVQTDPNVDDVAVNVRRVAKEYNIPLVDNRMIFKEKLKSHNKKEFFVEDDHCNADGYRVITENVHETLVKEGIINEFIYEGSNN